MSPSLVESPVVSQDPEVSGTRHGSLGRFFRAGVVDLAFLLGVSSQLREQLLDVRIAVADAVEGVFGPQLFKEACQRRLIPLRILVSAVVGDGEGHGLDARAIEPHDRDLDHVEFEGGLQPGVPGNDLARWPGHDRLPPAEAPQGGRDGADGRVVDPGIRGVPVQAPDRHPLDAPPSLCLGLVHRLCSFIPQVSGWSGFWVSRPQWTVTLNPRREQRWIPLCRPHPSGHATLGVERQERPRNGGCPPLRGPFQSSSQIDSWTSGATP